MGNPYFDRQLRSIIAILERDYAGLARSESPADFRYYIQAAGMAWKQGKLDQLLFLRYVSQMLATTGDRSLRLAVTADDYRPWRAGFDVRRVGDALYVTAAPEDARLRPGDRITELNGRSPGEHRARFQKNFLYGDTPEREMWGNVLKMAEDITVAHPDGGVERLPVLRLEGPRPAEPTRLLLPAPGAVQLVVGSLGSGEALERLVAGERAALDSAELLIIDLRRATGDDPAALLPLIPYILSEAKTMNEADGPQAFRTLYTRENCLRRLAQLEPYRDDPEAAGLIREIEDRYGAGWVAETFTLWDDLPQPISPRGRRVTLLTDTWTEGAPEAFALLAQKEGRAGSIGRATMGSLDYSTLIRVRVSDTAALTYPMSISEEAAQGRGFQGRGVVPHRVIPFTPEECREDILLKTALTQ